MKEAPEFPESLPLLSSLTRLIPPFPREDPKSRYQQHDSRREDNNKAHEILESMGILGKPNTTYLPSEGLLAASTNRARRQLHLIPLCANFAGTPPLLWEPWNPHVDVEPRSLDRSTIEVSGRAG